MTKTKLCVIQKTKTKSIKIKTSFLSYQEIVFIGFHAHRILTRAENHYLGVDLSEDR